MLFLRFKSAYRDLENEKPPLGAAFKDQLLFGLSMELFFFGRTSQGFDTRRAPLNHCSDVIEIARTHLLLMRHKGIALLSSLEFGLLDHVDVVLHALAARIGMRELERVVPIDVNASKSDELILVAQCGEFVLEGCDCFVIQVLPPIEGG